MQRFDDFMKEMLEHYPDATLDEDREGELVIYPGLRRIKNPFGEFVEPIE